METVR